MVNPESVAQNRCLGALMVAVFGLSEAMVVSLMAISADLGLQERVRRFRDLGGEVVFMREQNVSGSQR